MAPGRVAFALFGNDVYWYGILVAAGIVLGAVAAALREGRFGFPKGTAADFALIAVPLAIVFARAYYVAFTWGAFRDRPLSILDLRSGGMAIYGAVIGGALAAALFARRRRLSLWRLLDLFAPSVALGQAIGRWGNYLNQEAYGVAVGNPAARWFPLAVFIEREGAWHYAAFFYESVWCALIAALLFALPKGRRRDGDAFLWYAILYAAERAVVEGIRTDSLYMGPIRVSQALSAALILLSCGFFMRRALRAGRGAIGAAFGCAACASVVAGALPVWGVPALAQAGFGALALASAFGAYRAGARGKAGEAGWGR